MNRILENIKDFLFFITHPNYWIMNDTPRYSKEYDRWFNELLDNNEFTYRDKYVAELGGLKFWIANRPYSCFHYVDEHIYSYKFGTLRPSRRTIHKAIKKLNKFLVDRELHKIKTCQN
jgi:hypothetical protein